MRLGDSEVVISELLAKNSDTLVDEDGDSSDWIELYNGGIDAVDLDGWSLSDDEGRPRKWVFPARTLGAGEFLVILPRTKTAARRQVKLHTNFKLDSDGEYLALFDQEGRTVTEFTPGYGALEEDQSAGLHTEPGLWVLSSPTPGAGNESPLQLAAPSMQFSLPTGLYPDGTTVSLMTHHGEAVCTTDGSLPVAQSEPCPSAVTLGGVDHIRAAILDADGEVVGRASRHWLTVAPSEATFQSSFGIVVLEGYGNKQLADPWDREFSPVGLMVYDPGTPLGELPSLGGEQVPTFAETRPLNTRKNSTHSRFETKRTRTYRMRFWAWLPRPTGFCTRRIRTKPSCGTT